MATSQNLSRVSLFYLPGTSPEPKPYSAGWGWRLSLESATLLDSSVTRMQRNVEFREGG